MTPTQLEHLRLLKAHLETLLETAKKRAPGEWLAPTDESWNVWEMEGDEVGAHCIAHCGPKRNFARGMSSSVTNAAFIASCAGNAEAGWKSTLAAVLLIEQLDGYDLNIDETTSALLDKLVTAWPIETLQK